MIRLKNIVFSVLISINTLLLFFVILETRLIIPSWLQVFGRIHPLFLHFPIVLALIAAALLLFTPVSARSAGWYGSAMDIFLLGAAFTASVTALMGLFLSVGTEYDSEVIALHKWTGISMPFVLFFIYAFRRRLFNGFVIPGICGLLITALIIAAGHYGSEITHGRNFVLAPVSKDAKKALPSINDALLYTHLVEPILKDRCMSCHNSSKAKGKLIMETKELLMKGGKNGKLWDTSRPQLGLMMERIHLPVAEKKHMPPSGKPQLNGEEIVILERWIRQGADFTKKITDLETSDTLYQIAKKTFGSAGDETYNFPAADDKEISRLNNNNRLISPIAMGSPALRVSFFNRSLFKSSAIDELEAVSANITEMNFLNMPLEDIDLQKLKPFTNLRKLNLNFTRVTGKTLAELSGLAFLRSLSLSGTALRSSYLADVSSFAHLEKVYLWDTPLTADDIRKLARQNKKIVFQAGYYGDTTMLKLNPPIFNSEQDVIGSIALPVRIKHFINGTTIRYTLDGRDPDSINSPEYKSSLELNTNTLVKARVFKKGWFSSDVIGHYFFKSTYQPDSSVLLTSPQPAYRANGAKTLIDNEKSDLNFASRKWLGFQADDLECLLLFKDPVLSSNVTLSIFADTRSYIFPPQKVQVWGGTDKDHLKLLSTVHPRQTIQVETREIRAVECSFKPTELKVIKIKAEPLDNVPSWLQNLEKKGFVFVDEIFVN